MICCIVALDGYNCGYLMRCFG